MKKKLTHIKYIYVVLLILIVSCSSDLKNDPCILLKDQFKNEGCNKVLNGQYFQNNFNANLSNYRPKNIYESILYLDSATNCQLQVGISECDIINFHFSLGLNIRNSWIYGNSDLQENINTYGIYDADKSSAFIMYLYKLYLVGDEIDFLTKIYEDSGQVFDTLPTNYLILQNEINDLIEYNYR